MSKRLQVILPEADMRQIQHCARAEQLTVAEWVRRAIIAAQRGELAGDSGRKVGVVREALNAAARQLANDPFPQAYPTADMRCLLGEIERGYRTTTP